MKLSDMVRSENRVFLFWFLVFQLLVGAAVYLPGVVEFFVPLAKPALTMNGVLNPNRKPPFDSDYALVCTLWAMLCVPCQLVTLFSVPSETFARGVKAKGPDAVLGVALLFLFFGFAMPILGFGLAGVFRAIGDSPLTVSTELFLFSMSLSYGIRMLLLAAFQAGASR